mgnify:CR=1 FL=1|jgi:hypothetical protein|tara:strand:- start:735 stop:971 length:237 start_codon:yes stop_codon:yes gene_type:complete
MPGLRINMDQACVEANRQVRMMEKEAFLRMKKEENEAKNFLAYLAKEARKDEKKAAKEERKEARKAAKKAAKKLSKDE